MLEFTLFLILQTNTKVYICEILCVKSTWFKQLDTNSYYASQRNRVVTGVGPIGAICHLLENRKSWKILAWKNGVTIVVDRDRAQVLDAEEHGITTTYLSGTIYIKSFKFDCVSHSSADIFFTYT